ncbi:MAG: dipeptide epimerase [Verrucomicrobia bacterium]|nr:dipeptide epimerase [Verrucomicrobiota bacterium]
MARLPAVRSFDVQPLNIPLTNPFGISGGAQNAAENVLVRLELTDGTVGYGEAAPLPPYNGETQAQALAALTAAKPWVEGWVLEDDWRSAAALFRERGGAGCGSAQCAFESALLDAWTRRAQLPLWRFFGGAETTLETDMTVTTGSAAEAAAAARDIRARGIRMIKVKVGGKAGPAHDLARLQAIHETAPDSPLILDGNAGVSRADARTLVEGLRTRHITPALLEQWLPRDDLDGAAALRRETSWRVAADESVSTPADVARLVAAGAADVVNLKLMKAGVAAAFDTAVAARAAGLGLMIGGNVESILAMTVSACLATGLGGFQFADLDTPLFLAENPFTGGFTLDGGILSVATITAGHGVVPRAGSTRTS